MIRSPLSRALLYVPAKLYEFGVRTRIALYQTDYLSSGKLRAPVVSIGNLTVGGTGKTPLVSFLARFLRDEGYLVGILSRGYKRASTGRVEVSNGESILCGPAQAGDEPFLLARQCPGVRVVVDTNRAAAGKWLEERAPISAFILDDGFQHLSLSRELNVVLLDANEPTGDGRMVPFGLLREPLTGLARADAVIITRSDEPFDQSVVRSLVSQFCKPETPVFYAYHDLTNLRRLDSDGSMKPMAFSRRRVAVLSGIARPDRFIRDLEHFGIDIALRRDFPDHHRYHDDEFRQVVRDAVDVGAEAILTTEKDAANLSPDSLKSSQLPVYAAEIEFRCEDEPALKRLVLRAITGNLKERQK